MNLFTLQENKDALRLVEDVLKIRGGCFNPNADKPNGDEPCDCGSCLFEFDFYGFPDMCLKLVFDQWQDILEKKIGTFEDSENKELKT